MYTYNITVVRIIDGDTLIGNVDLGFNVWLYGLRFRLARINAPELGTDEGEAAKTSLMKRPIATVMSTGLDKWGRHLGEMYGPDGANINDAMVKDGFAKPVSYGEEFQ